MEPEISCVRRWQVHSTGLAYNRDLQKGAAERSFDLSAWMLSGCLLLLGQGQGKLWPLNPS